jgi:hypothetical protein
LRNQFNYKHEREASIVSRTRQHALVDDSSTLDEEGIAWHMYPFLQFNQVAWHQVGGRHLSHSHRDGRDACKGKGHESLTTL